jgi:hypothetical protein
MSLRTTVMMTIPLCNLVTSSYRCLNLVTVLFVYKWRISCINYYGL